MKAALLIIGDEVLSGDTLDTNSHFATRLLNANGIPVVNIITVKDSAKAIKEGLQFALDRAELVISTGGLGPTKDDITKASIADFFGCEMVFHENVINNIRERYQKRGIDLNKINYNQAMAPALADVIQNPVGTAPVTWIEKDEKVLVSLPGVPSEMRFLLENVLLPRIKERFVQDVVLQKTIQTAAIRESDLASRLEEVENLIDEANTEDTFYKLAYLPEMGTVKLQLTGIGKDREKIEEKINLFRQEIEKMAGDHIFGYDKEDLPTVIGRIMKEKNYTLGIAESCTGGYLSHKITSITGSADYFKGSVVCYTEEVKTSELGVSPDTLKKYGAVSEETLEEMLKGTLKLFNSDLAVATTGLAGPTTGGEHAEVGTVWIGIAHKDKIIKRRYRFDRNRLENIHLFTVMALDMLRRCIQDKEVEPAR